MDDLDVSRSYLGYLEDIPQIRQSDHLDHCGVPVPADFLLGQIIIELSLNTRCRIESMQVLLLGSTPLVCLLERCEEDSTVV